MTPQRLAEATRSARALKLQIDQVNASGGKTLEEALRTIARSRPAALLVFEDPILISHRQRIIDFSAQQRLPTVYTSPGWADRGGLVEYGPNQAEMYRRAAEYVDRILRGAKPRDLPVEQPTKFDLVINLRTAGTIGLSIPHSLLLRADRVIQ
jgi:putative ABC transport system substrate-binding protein